MRKVMFIPQRSNPIFLSPPPPDLAGVLSGCGTVAAVKQAHALALTGGAAPYIHNHLLSKLTLLADVPYANLLFSHLPSPSDFSYNVMIRALATTWRRPHSSLLLYFRMKAAGVRPNNFTFPFVFIACGDLSCFSCGEMAQSMIFRSGLDRDGHCVHSLISCYAKCGELATARKVFDEIAGRDRDVVSWSSMISGYSRIGFAREAVEMFRGMRVAGFKPNEMTLVSVLGACGDLGDLEMGRWIEGFVEASGMVVNSYIGSSLIDMYAKCGDLQSARQVFDRSGKKDMVVWNAMITG